MSPGFPRFRIPVLLLAASLSLITASCGYTSKTALPRNLKTIYVETFKNKMPIGEMYAFEPGLELKITNAVIRRLHQDGNVKVVSREDAEVVLEGDLYNLEQEGVRFTGLERVEEYRLFIITAIRLRVPKSSELLWEEENFSGDASYFVAGPRAVSRSIATDRAVERLARNIVDRIVEDW